MSILFLEGFDLYGNYGNPEQEPLVRRELWSGEYSSVDGISTQARNNGNALRLDTNVTGNTSNYVYMYLESKYLYSRDLGRVIGGFAFKKDSPGSTADSAPRLITLNGKNLVGSDKDPDLVAVIHTVSTGSQTDFDLQCIMYNHASVSFDTIPNVAVGVWHYIEYDIQVQGTTHLKIWLNGSLQIDIPGSTAWGYDFHSFGIHPAKDNYHPGGIWYDDMYMLDPSDNSQGAIFQDRLGPIQIRPVPLSSDGSLGSWTASSGGAKYEDVDEQPGPSDLDGTYISTSSAPQTQTFKSTAYDSSSPIIALSTYAVVKQEDPNIGVANLAFIADSQEDISQTALQGVYRMHWNDYITLPGGALSVPVIEATEFGIRSIEGT